MDNEKPVIEGEVKDGSPPADDSNEKVTMTKGQFRGLVERLETLEKGKRFKIEKRVTEHTAKIRYYEDKPVVWYGNVHEVKDNLTGKLVSFMDIKLKGEKDLINVDYLKFLNSEISESFKVKIKSQKADKSVARLGIRAASNPDPVKSKKTWQGHDVEDEVVTYSYTATVEVLEGSHLGDTFNINVNCLNT